jgi:pimeloyl-ACP methyl ester carboxylesterase
MLQRGIGVDAGGGVLCSVGTSLPARARRPVWHVFQLGTRTFGKIWPVLMCQTLVIHGDDDRIVPIGAAGQRTAKLVKGARLVVVKGGSHFVTWTHAEEVYAELLSFLG